MSSGLVLVVLAVVAWSRSRIASGPDGRGSAGTTDSVRHSKAGERDSVSENEVRRRLASISEAAEKWRAEILLKYPDLAPVFRDVPDERNGYLQALILAESGPGSLLPLELRSMFAGETVWNAAAFASWLAEHRTLADEVLRVAELTDRSAGRVDVGRLHGCAESVIDFGNILNGCARLAAESGDLEKAFRYSDAASNMAGNLAGIECPNFMHEVLASRLRKQTGDFFMEGILPTLKGDQEQMRRWRGMLIGNFDPSGEYGRAMVGEWNLNVADAILPALLGGTSPVDGPFQIPDIDAFLDTYANVFRGWVAEIGTGRRNGALDWDLNAFSTPESGLSRESAHYIRLMTEGIPAFYRLFGAEATCMAMRDAAIAIMLGEEPPVDPVSGKPFVWDPATRVLTAPPDPAVGIDSIRLP